MPRVTFLFWNLHDSLRAFDLTFQAAAEHGVDVLVLAECPIPHEELEEALRSRGAQEFDFHKGAINERILLLIRDPVRCEGIAFESQYLIVWDIAIPGVNELLLATMHGISQRNDKLLSLNEEATVAAGQLRDTEQNRRHRRTLLMGDFNLNPFDEGMAKARGFHAVMAQSIALNETKRVKFQDYPLFYNPMWSRIGDCSKGPPGTYHFYKAEHLNYHWWMYDQILLRPSLIDSFQDDDLYVLDAIGDVTLIDKDGIPDIDRASDHLPVMITLTLT